MDVAQIEEKITPRTKAIMAVHIYGLPTDMQPLLDIAKKYRINVIEDAAEMHGQTYRGQPCGGFGEISTFSFYPNKLITTGEGGMIVTNNDALAENCRELRNLCFQPKKRFVHERLGWNARMTNLQAALGLAQLERLDALVAKKRHIGKLYSELLEGTSGIKLPISHTDYAINIYWVFGIVLEDHISIDANEAISRLGKVGIGCRPFFCPMHLQPVLKRRGFFENESYPESERLWSRGFYVPSGMALTDEQVCESAQKVKDILR
jgi:perosamine synthetase